MTELRHVVADRAAALGLHGHHLDDFVLAVNELMANAVRHGGGHGWLRLWRRGPTLFCEVSDHGHGIDIDQLSRQERPAPDTVGGRGLWLTRQLSDDMRIWTGDAGTTVRISATIGRPTTPAAPRSTTRP
ncbi:MAG TPA: ATP-binding protein [Micromonospora sp.]|nr:ATP-binding protein [Micromonospora sp.]